jgi:hypothetical protein
MGLFNYFYEDHWMIGTAPFNLSEVIQNGIDFKKATFYATSKEYYYADPFWHSSLGHDNIICERFDFKSQHGSLSKLNLADGKLSSEKTFLKENWHLSFPFLIEIDGVLKMIPESSYNKETSIYNVNDLKAKLFMNSALVDPIVYFYNDTYWLFAGLQNGKQNEELHLFVSKDSENWEKHSSSPICVTAIGGRMAGNIFNVDNELYRLGQNSEKGYGKGVVIFKITSLSQDLYEEEEVARIDPPEGYSGFHTMNQFGDKIVFDVKKTYFSALKPLRRIKRKLFS